MEKSFYGQNKKVTDMFKKQLQNYVKANGGLF
jgi:hypothetical protein